VGRVIPRSRIPLVILTVLTLLVAGAAVLAIFQSRQTATTLVYNATAKSFDARSFTLDITSSVSSGPGSGVITQIRRVDYTSASPSTMVVHRIEPEGTLLGTLHGGSVKQVLTGYRAVTGGATAWSGSGTHFSRTESLVVFNRRVYHENAESGTVSEAAIVIRGRLIKVTLKVVVPSQVLANGTKTSGARIGEILDVLRIDGTRTPPVGS
jgi:hypothetical protein